MMLTKRSWYATQPAMGFAEIREEGTDRLIFAVANPLPAHGDPETSDEEKHANLALAASAPDLLEACKLALNAWEKNWAIDWAELERAIAKAEAGRDAG